MLGLGMAGANERSGQTEAGILAANTACRGKGRSGLPDRDRVITMRGSLGV